MNGVPATQFDPSQGVGTYVIVYTVDGGVPKAFGTLNDPGCIQSVSLTVHVVATPSVPTAITLLRYPYQVIVSVKFCRMMYWKALTVATAITW